MVMAFPLGWNKLVGTFFTVMVELEMPLLVRLASQPS